MKKRANERGIEVSGMDNESLFGSVFHTLNFASAINNKPQLLTDYQVVIVGVDQPMIAQWIKDRELVRTSKGEATNAKDLAAQLGLIKAIKDYDLNRLISFHSRVKNARSFSVEIQHAIDIVDHEYRPKGHVWSDYVSGEMTTRSRNTKLKQLKELSNCQIGILSNARCLSEGVDVPSLDGVAFIDPKSSQVDIIQAVGRAIRLSDHKTIGTIVLPVFIEQDDNEIESIESSNFKPIWDVINALRSHDEELSLELDQLRTQMGSEGIREVRDISDKIIFDIPETVGASFSRSLKTKIVEKTSASWDFMFGLLKKHISVYGNSLPSGKDKFEGYNLEGWVSKQRVYKKQNELSIDRIQKLESLKEWFWDALEYQWDEWLKDIKVYIEKYGSKLPSSSSITNKKDKYLIRRIQTIRKTYRENKLSIKKIKQAETIKGWSWDPVQDSWNELIQRIKAYIAEHKNSHISSTHKTSDGYTLGNRINSLRNKYKKNKLDTEKISELESIEGWTWDQDAESWDEFVFNLKKYQKINKGNALIVPVSHQIDGYPLGKKISFYRKKYRKNFLANKQIKEIESLHGWSWEPMKEVFPTFIEQLKIFIKKYGHARVHQSYENDGYALVLE